MFFDRRIPCESRSQYHYDSISNVLNGVFLGLVLIFLPVIARRMGASGKQIALITAAPFIGFLFSMFWDRFSEGRKKVPFVSGICVLGCSVFFATSFVAGPLTMVAMVLVFHLIWSMKLPAYAGVMREIYPDKDRSRLMGYTRVKMALAMIIAAYVGGHLIQAYGYKYVFPLGALFGILSAFAFKRIKCVDEHIHVRAGKKFPLVEALDLLKENKAFSRYLCILFLFGFGNLMAMPLYTIFLVDVLDIPNATVGKLGALFSLMWMISYFAWGEYMGKRHPLMVIPLVISSLALVPLTYFFATNIWYVVFAYAMLGIASGGLELAWFSCPLYFAGPNKELASRYMAVNTTFNGIRGVIAPFVGIGLMYILGIKAVFAIAFILMLVAAILMRSFSRKTCAVTEISPAVEPVRQLAS